MPAPESQIDTPKLGRKHIGAVEVLGEDSAYTLHHIFMGLDEDQLKAIRDALKDVKKEISSKYINRSSEPHALERANSALSWGYGMPKLEPEDVVEATRYAQNLGVEEGARQGQVNLIGALVSITRA